MFKLKEQKIVKSEQQISQIIDDICAQTQTKSHDNLVMWDALWELKGLLLKKYELDQKKCAEIVKSYNDSEQTMKVDIRRKVFAKVVFEQLWMVAGEGCRPCCATIEKYTGKVERPDSPPIPPTPPLPQDDDDQPSPEASSTTPDSSNLISVSSALNPT